MLLEVLNGNSSIIHGSLVLEPACTMFKLLASSEEAATEGGKSWTGFSSKIVARHFPSASIDRLNSSKIDHFTWRTVIGQTRTRNSSFWQSHWSQPSTLEQPSKIIKAGVIVSMIAVTVLCVFVKQEKCEICLAGFPANDGANLRELLIISLPAEPVCENYQLPASYTKTCSNAIHV